MNWNLNELHKGDSGQNGNGNLMNSAVHTEWKIKLNFRREGLQWTHGQLR